MSQPEFNDGQRRRLLALFSHIDELLADTAQTLALDGDRSPGGAQRPFGRHLADATPVQRKVIADYAARVRQTMLAALRRNGIEPPRPDVSAVWAARSYIRSAAIAAEELAPRYMRGYGELADELARELNLTSAALIELLDQMDAYLARGPGRELHERLEKVVASPDSRLLAELARLVTAHGLIELRATLEMLIERLESPALEVAVFGRVNSGKSSLLNYLLGREVLPVGVTPITAVPTRIVHGPKAEGTAWFVDAQTERFDLARMAEFASERQNPSNVRHVTQLQLTLPAPILADGVVLVDTPGIGALATTGAAEALAYLPRCDVGIVLVDAVSSLTAEDTALVDALLRAGAQVMVLLTKADLLTAEDGIAALSYVEGQLVAAVGQHVPVHRISVRGEAAALCDSWVTRVLQPRLRDCRRLQEQSLARKIEGLKADVVAALQRRVATAERRVQPAASPQHETRPGGGVDDISAALFDALAQFDRVRDERVVSFPDPQQAAAQVVAEAAHNSAVIWGREFAPSFDATALLAASLDGRAGAAAGTVQRQVVAAQAALANAIAAAAEALPEFVIDGSDLGRPAALPVLQAAGRLPQILLAKPTVTMPLRAVLAHQIRGEFERRRLPELIARALADYDRKLQGWRAETLDAMRRQYVALATRVASRAGAAGAAQDTPAALRDDLERLRRFGEEHTPGQDRTGERPPERAERWS